MSTTNKQPDDQAGALEQKQLELSVASAWLRPGWFWDPELNLRDYMVVRGGTTGEEL